MIHGFEMQSFVLLLASVGSHITWIVDEKKIDTVVVDWDGKSDVSVIHHNTMIKLESTLIKLADANAALTITENDTIISVTTQRGPINAEGKQIIKLLATVEE